MAGPGAASPATVKPLPGGPELLGDGQRLEENPPEAGTATQPCGALPAKAFRSFPRQAHEDTKLARGEAKRKVGIRQVNEPIRSSCPSRSRILQSGPSTAEEMRSGRANSDHGGPKTFWPSSSMKRGSRDFVIELFSGCARFSRSCAEKGFTAFAWDIDYGLNCDLLNPHVLKKVKLFIMKHRHRIALIWFGTPCTSWSLARRLDGGPPPLRDDDCFLMSGMPNLSLRDQQKVEQGNALLAVTLELIELCAELGLNWVLENPWTSRIWLTSGIKQLLSDRAMLQRVDYCSYGTPWRKSTGLLSNLHQVILPACTICQPVAGRCQYSHHRHLALSGKDANGNWLTLRAQPYPVKFCRRLAQLFSEHF